MATADRARSSKSESGVSRSRRLVSRVPGTVEAYGGSMPTDSALATSLPVPLDRRTGRECRGGSLGPGFPRAPFQGFRPARGGLAWSPESVSPAREQVSISSALLPPPLGDSASCRRSEVWRWWWRRYPIGSGTRTLISKASHEVDELDCQAV